MARAWTIAFLACNKNADRYAGDASWRYRADNLARALRALGHTVLCGHVSRSPVQPVDVAVLHRPQAGWALQRRLAAWRRAGARVIADFDDLVFEPALAAESPAVLNRRLPEAEVRQRFAAHRRLLGALDGFTVSTQALQDELQAVLAAERWPRPVHWLPNAVHLSWRGLPATPWPAPAPALGYFSGTHSHDLDLAEAAPGLARALQARPGWRLQLVGPGDFALALAPEQLQRLPRLSFDNGYTDALRAVAVALLPLQPTRFNRCKSALKLIEAGWWNVPVLASPLPDAQRFAGPGWGEVAGPADWAPALAAWLDDPAERARQAHGWRERVLAQADIHRLAPAWLTWARQALGVEP